VRNLSSDGGDQNDNYQNVEPSLSIRDPILKVLFLALQEKVQMAQPLLDCIENDFSNS